MKTVLGRGGDQKSDVVSRLDKLCWGLDENRL